MTPSESRGELVTRLFPGGLPRLWCPPLTHFAAGGVIDAARQQTHLARLAPHARGWLMPGSTGEGWQLDAATTRRLLEIAFPVAAANGVRILIGVLRTSVEAMIESIAATRGWIAEHGWGDCCAGYCVCPPAGAELSQNELESGLGRVAAIGVPLALYQLPQVTHNELDPNTVQRLVRRWPNIYLLKDTSGHDRVVNSGLDFGGLAFVRGAERGYAGWTHAGGGPYDGLLLSSANAFADRYVELLGLLENDELVAARALSLRLQAVVDAVFRAVDALEVGNPFTNANKALDHVLAHGPGAAAHPPPLLCDGSHLPRHAVTVAERALRHEGLMVERGYLA